LRPPLPLVSIQTHDQRRSSPVDAASTHRDGAHSIDSTITAFTAAEDKAVSSISAEDTLMKRTASFFFSVSVRGARSTPAATCPRACGAGQRVKQSTAVLAWCLRICRFTRLWGRVLYSLGQLPL
jgi:hypothetical protein